MTRRYRESFLVGLVTKHVGTKFLALVLALVLYVFVREGLSSEAEVPAIKIRFVLDKELQQSYVLMNDEINVDGGLFWIQGLRGRVEEQVLAVQNKADGAQITVGSKFLALYPAKDGGYDIPIDRNFIRRFIVGANKKVEISRGATAGRLIIEQKVHIRLRPTIGKGWESFLEIKEDSDFSPARINPDHPRRVPYKIEPAEIPVSGPRSYLRSLNDGDPLYVAPPDVNEVLKTVAPASGEMTPPANADAIEWDRSGLPTTAAKLRKLVFETGPNSTTTAHANLHKEIGLLFRVTQAQKTGTAEFKLKWEWSGADSPKAPPLGRYNIKAVNLQEWNYNEAAGTVEVSISAPASMFTGEEFRLAADFDLVIPAASAVMTIEGKEWKVTPVLRPASPQDQSSYERLRLIGIGTGGADAPELRITPK